MNKSFLSLLLLLFCGTAQATFTHVQGAGHTLLSGTYTTVSVTLGAAPTTGNLVVVGLSVFDSSNLGAPSALTVQDSNNNSYVVTPNSPSAYITDGSGHYVNSWLAYLLSAPSNASATITATWTTNVNVPAIFAEEFSYTGGSCVFDTDVSASNTTPGTTINTPSITPTNAGSLLYSVGSTLGSLTAPAAAGTLGGWTGGAGNFKDGVAVEYILSGSGAHAVDYTGSSAGWSAMAMSFYINSTAPKMTLLGVGP
jgi:hypothetical protein